MDLLEVVFEAGVAVLGMLEAVGWSIGATVGVLSHCRIDVGVTMLREEMQDSGAT